jgi:uncharacterized Zn finger protein (UPF0148 family)
MTDENNIYVHEGCTSTIAFIIRGGKCYHPGSEVEFSKAEYEEQEERRLKAAKEERVREEEKAAYKKRMEPIEKIAKEKIRKFRAELEELQEKYKIQLYAYDENVIIDDLESHYCEDE